MNASKFETGQSVVHPVHGVGNIEGMEHREIAGEQLLFYVISFVRQKLTLRVPSTRLDQDGVRPLASLTIVTRALEILGTPSKVKQSDQYRLISNCDEQIKSGDLVSAANVARDLYRTKSVRDIPYSVENMFQTAVTRLVDEVALVRSIDARSARSLVMSSLKKQHTED